MDKAPNTGDRGLGVISQTRILMQRVFALICAFLWCATAVAQVTDIRTIARNSGVTGLPDIEIDLSAPARKKHAFIVGNGDYSDVKDLKNATSDARLVSDYFRSAGYLVNDFYDIDKQGFEGAMRKMLFEVSNGDEVVFYFAGHGVQIGKSNYIFPTDATLNDVFDVPFEAVSVSSLLSIVGARARSLVVILDSCRDNPFGDKQAVVGLDAIPAELENGFSAQNSPINTLLVYSTSPGAVAADGFGDNSPFTSAFVEVARANPGKPLDLVLKHVRRAVYEGTGGLQVPWESSSMVEPIYVSETAIADDAVLPGAAAMSAPDVRISTALQPDIQFGNLLRGKLGLPQSASISLANAPHRGRIELAGTSGTRGLTAVRVDSADIDALTYASTSPVQPALIKGSNPQVDQFRLTVDGETKTVELELKVDPCDFHAGDYLDPEGVGIARYPNEIEPEAALAACQAAVAAQPDVGRFHYQLGRAHMALRDLESAYRSFKTAQQLGHTRAWYGLGLAKAAQAKETQGAGADKAPNGALASWAMGVADGDPYAMHALGRQFLLHSEDKLVRRQGYELMSRALEMGHTFSMNALGVYFLDKDTEHYNPERGLRYFRESAARGDIYGYNNMGYVALNGLGDTEKDMDAAFDWFKRASDEGHPSAPSSIGRMYNKGLVDGKVDLVKAVDWFDQGLSRGDAWGGVNAARAIARNNLPGYSVGDAAVRAAKASILRNPQAVSGADKLLLTLNERALDQGSQLLMQELGADITADGAFGAASNAALDKIAAEFGRDVPNNSLERIKALASMYWQSTKFRADLY